MKITKITTYSVHANQFRNFNYVRVDTDEGIHGVGELFCVGADKCVLDMVDYISEWVIGQNPLERERIQKRIFNYSRFPGGSVLATAASAIDLALWDIAGKTAGLPVYRLMGAVRDKVPVYCHSYGKTAEESLEALYPKKEKYGYFATKILVPELGYHPAGRAERAISDMFEKMRTALGDDYEIGIDMASKIFEPIQAKRCIQAIEPYRPLFAEEPIRPENIENWAEVAAEKKVPIATGEQIFTLWDYDRLLKLHAVDILQPDILLAGGITGMTKIAALAEASFRNLSPHNPLSSLANCINVHFCMSTYNISYLENDPREEGLDKDMFTTVLHVKDGFITPNEEPGWGMDLNYDFLKTMSPIVWSRVNLAKPTAYTLSGAPHIM